MKAIAIFALSLIPQSSFGDYFKSVRQFEQDSSYVLSQIIANEPKLAECFENPECRAGAEAGYKQALMGDRFQPYFNVKFFSDFINGNVPDGGLKPACMKSDIPVKHIASCLMAYEAAMKVLVSIAKNPIVSGDQEAVECQQQFEEGQNAAQVVCETLNCNGTEEEVRVAKHPCNGAGYAARYKQCVPGNVAKIWLNIIEQCNHSDEKSFDFLASARDRKDDKKQGRAN